MKETNAAAGCWFILVLVLLMAPAAVRAKDTDKHKLPSVDQIEAVVEQYFARQSDHQPGDIISKSQVRDILQELQRGGWDVPRQEDLIAKVLDDSDMVVRALRTKDGRKFARQIDRYPLAYDRLDRLVRMPTGKSILARLVKGPDGYKLLQYMTEAPGGNEMGRMLSGTPSGRDFNKPTGRIYTSAGLIEQLRERHQESFQAIRRGQARVWGLKTSQP